MFDEIASYNVVSPSTVEKFVAELYGQIESSPNATPEATPDASPELGTTYDSTVAFTPVLPRNHPQLGIVKAERIRYDQQEFIG